MLIDCHLISEHSSQGVIDAHPLIREYFAKQLREQNPTGWRAAHKRLYEYLKDSTEYQPDTLEDLQPLYQAVAHGCQAGLHQKACDDVYYTRILRGTEADGFYSTRKLGAFGTDLAAVSCFFEHPWNRLAPGISEPAQGWLLNQVACWLHALGRLTEALEPMRAGLPIELKRGDWENAAIRASNLSVLELTLGRVADAVRDAENSVEYADRSGDAFQRMSQRTAHANALHQAGQSDDALRRFGEAEVMQAENQSKYPLLYSLQGFHYCDLLLAEAERAAWQCTAGFQPVSKHGQAARTSLIARCREVEKRAAQTLGWSEGELGLLSRAWLRTVEGDFENARADLNDAWEIAERGPMPLFIADIHLYRARLFRREREYPWTSPKDDLTAARKLIDECGYHSRDAELADAEAAIA